MSVITRLEDKGDAPVAKVAVSPIFHGGIGESYQVEVWRNAHGLYSVGVQENPKGCEGDWHTVGRRMLLSDAIALAERHYLEQTEGEVEPQAA